MPYKITYEVFSLPAKVEQIRNNSSHELESYLKVRSLIGEGDTFLAVRNCIEKNEASNIIYSIKESYGLKMYMWWQGENKIQVFSRVIPLQYSLTDHQNIVIQEISHRIYHIKVDRSYTLFFRGLAKKLLESSGENRLNLLASILLWFNDIALDKKNLDNRIFTVLIQQAQHMAADALLVSTSQEKDLTNKVGGAEKSRSSFPANAHLLAYASPLQADALPQPSSQQEMTNTVGNDANSIRSMVKPTAPPIEALLDNSGSTPSDAAIPQNGQTPTKTYYNYLAKFLGESKLLVAFNKLLTRLFLPKKATRPTTVFCPKPDSHNNLSISPPFETAQLPPIRSADNQCVVAPEYGDSASVDPPRSLLAKSIS